MDFTELNHNNALIDFMLDSNLLFFFKRSQDIMWKVETMGPFEEIASSRDTKRKAQDEPG